MNGGKSEAIFLSKGKTYFHFRPFPAGDNQLFHYSIAAVSTDPSAYGTPGAVLSHVNFDYASFNVSADVSVGGNYQLGLEYIPEGGDKSSSGAGIIRNKVNCASDSSVSETITLPLNYGIAYRVRPFIVSCYGETIYGDTISFGPMRDGAAALTLTESLEFASIFGGQDVEIRFIAPFDGSYDITVVGPDGVLYVYDSGEKINPEFFTVSRACITLDLKSGQKLELIMHSYTKGDYQLCAKEQVRILLEKDGLDAVRFSAPDVPSGSAAVLAVYDEDGKFLGMGMQTNLVSGASKRIVTEDFCSFGSNPEVIKAFLCNMLPSGGFTPVWKHAELLLD